MKDELTAKMHSEFFVDPATEVSHRVMSAKTLLKSSNYRLEEVLEMYDLTKDQFIKHLPDWS